MKTNSSASIFGFAAIASVAVLLAVLFGLGPAALATTLILAIIEITFSFDNAIVNAKILERLSPAWQTAFLTVGIVLAVFVIRFFLPILIVALTAGLGLGQVVTLAFSHPGQYADQLRLAHPLIASFGGAFLLTLALEFFVNDEHEVFLCRVLEKPLKKLANFWLPAAISLALVLVLALASSANRAEILEAGVLGVGSFVLLQVVSRALSRAQPQGKHLAGWAGLGLFVYLQFLDASFSLDGVIGAFAISDKVILIAAGLGIGALWVRSLTIFMVRRGTLGQYIYLEHGAFYTIGILALSLLASLFVGIPSFVTGLVGLVIIGAAVLVSCRAAATNHL